MPYPLNNVSTSDNFTDAATLTPHAASSKLNVVVTNSTVYMSVEKLQPGMKPGSGQYDEPEIVVPGYYNRSYDAPIGNVRFRSGVIGAPGQVIASMGT
jgi:hypothetical protein